MVDPRAAVANLDRLAGIGDPGRHGFYEAVDYTRNASLRAKASRIVRAFMAHHQGMTIVAIADVLLEGAMRARFHSEPIIKATELLLQERMPLRIGVGAIAVTHRQPHKVITAVCRRVALAGPRLPFKFRTDLDCLMETPAPCVRSAKRRRARQPNESLVARFGRKRSPTVVSGQLAERKAS